MTARCSHCVPGGSEVISIELPLGESRSVTEPVAAAAGNGLTAVSTPSAASATRGMRRLSSTSFRS